jgi:hypothetical protein
VHGRTVFPLCSGTTGMGQSCSAETLGRRVEAGIPSCLVVVCVCVCVCVLLCVLLYVWEGGQERGGRVGLEGGDGGGVCVVLSACIASIPAIHMHASPCLHASILPACQLLPASMPSHCLPAAP